MKKTKLFGWAFVATMMGTSFSACTNDLENSLAKENEIKLTSEIVPSRVTSLDYQSTQIVEGQQVGVTITGAKSEHKNAAWNVGEEGELSNTGDPVYYGDGAATITAYHPFNDDWDENTSYAFSVNTDQSSEENYRNSDLLWATATSSKTESAVPLVFKHKLAKINVTLTSEDITDLSNATISICGTNIATSFNPTDGALYAATANVADIKAGVTTTSAYTASAIVVPQTVAYGSKFIKIVLGDRTFYYTLSTDKELRAGYSHNYTLNINDKEVTAESDKITDWEDDDNEGDVEEELISKYADGVAFVAKAGELRTIIPEDEKYAITSLTISGELNGTDLKFIREMTGIGFTTDEQTEGKLLNLDLSDVNIVAGGDYYYKSGPLVYSVNNDQIPPCLFYGSPIKSIIIPNSITIVGEAAFYNCKYLQSVIMPNSLTLIGEGAFKGCVSLTSVDIPNGVELIYNNAFEGCTSLNSVIIPESVKAIDDGAFHGCSSLTSIDIPNGITYIGSHAFYGNSALTNVYCHATTPPEIDADSYPTFEYYENTTTLHVPTGCVTEYQSSDWGEFFPNIKEMK